MSKNKEKDKNEIEMNEIYKYDIKKEEINELNKIINTLEEYDDTKTLNEIIKNDVLKKDDKLKLKNIQKKINNTKNRYSKKNENENNKDDNEDVKLSYSFIYFCKESDKYLLSDKNKIYKCKRCDKKISMLSYKSTKIILNEIIKNKKKHENYEIDTAVKNHYDKQNIENNNENDYIIYHRIKIFDKKMSNLFSEIKFSFSKIMNDILKDYYDNINKNINKNINDDNKKIICENIYNILIFIKEKINTQDILTQYKEKYIKSKGELITSIFLILYFGTSFNINTEPLINEKTNKKLELDFYFDDCNLAIEIDGGHHNNLKQKKTDLIKNFLCEDQNIKLIRIDTTKNNTTNTIDQLFEKIEEFIKKSSIIKNKNITKEQIIDIVKFFEKNYDIGNKYIIENKKNYNNLNKNNIIKTIESINDDVEIDKISNMFNIYLKKNEIINKVNNYNKEIQEKNKIVENKIDNV